MDSLLPNEGVIANRVSLNLGSGDQIPVLVRHLNFQKRKKSPAQLKGFEPTHHTPVWDNKSPWASLQVAVLYLVILKENSIKPNNMMEVCWKTM